MIGIWIQFHAQLFETDFDVFRILTFFWWNVELDDWNLDGKLLGNYSDCNNVNV